MTDLFDDQFELEDVEAERRSDRRDKARRQQQRRVQRRRNILTFVVMLVSLGLLVGGAFVLIRPLFSDRPAETSTVSDYPGPGSGEVQVVVNPGDTGTNIGNTLVEANVVASVGAFVSAYNANPRAINIQAGTYTLQEEMAAADAVQALLDPASRSDLTVTIPEGWRASRIYDRIATRMDVPLDEVEQAAAEVSAEDLPDVAGGEIEGWLFPSTYTVPPDSDPKALLQQMVAQTVRVLGQREAPEADWPEILNKASIVEMEVFLPEERPMVARVLENRLAGCSADGTIGMDTTYAYGLNKVASQITREEWLEPHPYNTREVRGLPPTPIASPGADSIDAVLSPAEGNWCYFVTVNPDEGETRFTDDYNEHLRNQEEFRQWRDSRTQEAEDDAEDGDGGD